MPRFIDDIDFLVAKGILTDLQIMELEDCAWEDEWDNRCRE